MNYYVTNTRHLPFDNCVPAAIDHAKTCWPNEACGAVIDGVFIPFENRAADPGQTFLIQDGAFDEAYRQGRVQCVIHSHNDYPHASQEDQQQQQALDVPFGIINMRNKSVMHVVFWGRDLPREPLVGRQFFFGVWDCFAVVRDFIRERFRVVAPDPPREFGFWFREERIFEQFMGPGQLPFRQVDLRDLRPDDILFYGRNGTRNINHCAVMRDNGLALHHFQNQISREFPAVYEREYLYMAMRFDPAIRIDQCPEWEVAYD